MTEASLEERGKKASKLETRHGKNIVASSAELYRENAEAIGIALEYLDCDCVVLRPFDQNGDIVTDVRVLRDEDSCQADHSGSSEGKPETTVYKNILWKDSPEEFDRKYGNDKRIEIASKLFP
jgi:hypothetical protein